MVLQLPVLVHGPNKIADSSLIFEYLCNTFPEQMKVFHMQDPVKYAFSSASTAVITARVVFAAVHMVLLSLYRLAMSTRLNKICQAASHRRVRC